MTKLRQRKHLTRPTPVLTKSDLLRAFARSKHWRVVKIKLAQPARAKDLKGFPVPARELTKP